MKGTVAGVVEDRPVGHLSEHIRREVARTRSADWDFRILGRRVASEALLQIGEDTGQVVRNGAVMLEHLAVLADSYPAGELLVGLVVDRH